MQIHLETARLILRRFTPDDLELLVDLDSDPKVTRYINGGSPIPREVIERDSLPRFLWSSERASGSGQWAAVEKASGDFLGRVFLSIKDTSHPEVLDLGYRLRQAAWGQGYATEASRALIRAAFADPSIQRITAGALADNIASRRVMEKAGLTLVQTARVTFPDLFAGVEQEVVRYALERAEWERQAATRT